MTAYKYSTIKNIQKGLVAVSGLVISQTENNFVIDDGTGPIIINSPEKQEGTIRVFGISDGESIFPHVIQNINQMDKFLYKEANNIIYGKHN